MSSKYTFKFQGTKEMFLDSLKCFPNYEEKTYYIDDYMVRITEDSIQFGVERCGHSGGNWFVPVITEHDDRVEFSGTIKYIGPTADENEGMFRKVMNRLEELVLFVFVLPFFIIFMLYRAIEWCIRKLIRRPKEKEKTTEEKLYDLMEQCLCCTRQ